MPELALRSVSVGVQPEEHTLPLSDDFLPSGITSLRVITSVSAPREHTSAELTRIRVKNRRKRYLDIHPEYFTNSSLELADPLAYDRLVRRFQTPSEREEEGRRKGYSGVLESDLYRSEAKVAALANPAQTTLFQYRRGPNGEILAEEKGDVPKNKEEGWIRWRMEMEMRFLRGGDEDFEYGDVDQSEKFDDWGLEEREAEEKWFEEEEPQWVEGNEVGVKGEESLEGQTGVQDF
ncbi:hypothetical protein MMC25_001620 [Agyrium rufum]|nr:hypothetical protein [Agyrium rufum]